MERDLYHRAIGSIPLTDRQARKIRIASALNHSLVHTIDRMDVCKLVEVCTVKH
jgi:hypothetical protein